MVNIKNLRLTGNSEYDAREFLKIKPLYYDSLLQWWYWGEELFRWKQCDLVDILNQMKDVFRTFDRGIMEHLKLLARRNKPLDVPTTWIQFKDNVMDFESSEIFKAKPAYFLVNPLPWTIGNSEDTPNMDALFKEWVKYDGLQDETYVNTLYEIIAYSISQEQFLQRIIAFCGSGSNGKGAYMNLLRKFIGEENFCASSLKYLSGRSFETSALYKKLVCMFGEVEAHEMYSSNEIKTLTGEDLMRYEFKGKTAFTERSITTPIICTNSLPITPDKSIGFYRRWLIVDFPNQFPITRNLLDRIPNVEYANLARKCIRILRELSEKGEFTNGGTIEERTKKYEARSNPLNEFIEANCEIGEEQKEKLRIFCIKYNDFLESKRLRTLTIIEIGKRLREQGWRISSRKWGEDSITTIGGLSIKNNNEFKRLINDEKPLKPSVFMSHYSEKPSKLSTFMTHYDEKPLKPSVSAIPEKSTNDQEVIKSNGFNGSCNYCGKKDAFIINENNELLCVDCAGAP